MNNQSRNSDLKVFSDLTIIVPIYNGYDAFEKLVQSLNQTYPQIPAPLEFLFINDASTDPRVQALLQSDPFFSKQRVSVKANPQNLGFVKTVNRGLRETNPKADVILLNSDTLVYGNAFAILQTVAHRYPHTASVTPLTNQCTIASLANWPTGTERLFELHPAEVTQVIEEAQIPTPYHNAPTGVGFCMYLTRKALDEVGFLDEENFGKGYGEENDWSQKAIKKGLTHLISTETFVFHQGTQSFDKAEKEALGQKNLQKVIALHPDYLQQVHDYIQYNPTFEARNQLLWRLRAYQKNKLGLKTVMFFLHSPPDNIFGGTEAVVRGLSQELLNDGKTEVLHVFPTGTKDWKIRLLLNGHELPYFEIDCIKESFGPTFQSVLQEVDVLHVQHLMHSNPEVLRSIQEASISKKIFSAHDLSLISQEFNLLKDQNEVAYGVGLEDPLRLLQIFDQILLPSETACQLYSEKIKTIGEARRQNDIAQEVISKLQVLPNMLSFASDQNIDLLEKAKRKHEPKLIVFLGCIVPHKGLKAILEVLPLLRERGYEPEIWGKTFGDFTDEAPVVSYSSWKDLLNLVKERKPHFVCLPSDCPETFSFTLYESLGVIQAPVLVGPYGNPAQVVSKLGTGVIISEIRAKNILDAVEELERDYDAIEKCVHEKWKKAIREFSPANYLNRIKEIYSFNEISLKKTNPFELAPWLFSLPKANGLGQVYVSLNRLQRDLHDQGVHVRNLEGMIKEYQNIVHTLSTKLNLVGWSKNWKVAKKVRRGMNCLLPQGSRRRDQVKRLLGRG